MQSSLLHSAELPAFDRTTGQLALASHHLVSAPLSFLDAFPPEHTLVFDKAPAKPYQQPQETAADDQPRRKRRRTAAPEASTPADFHALREQRERQTTTDRESDEHHSSVALDLRAAIEAVQGGWAERTDEGWMGRLDARVEWRERGGDDDDRTELDLVALAMEHAGDLIDAPLCVEPPQVQLPTTQLFSRVVSNDSLTACTIIDVSSEPSDDESCTAAALASLLLPPSSGFLMSDLTTWSLPTSGVTKLGRDKGGWDIVVIDPPWPNASATRSFSYETFDAYDLWKLDLPALLGDRPALVAVWLTNRVKFRRLVKEKLFPSWRIRGAAEWWWIKIASETGEPVWPLEAKHRRCYEGALLVGHYVPPGTQALALPSIPQGKVFLSTPVGHSRKPFILDLLRPYLPSSARPPNVLELFARMTLSGPRPDSAGEAERDGRRGFYLAVGNEAVKFNVLERAGGAVRGWVRSGGDVDEAVTVQANS